MTRSAETKLAIAKKLLRWAISPRHVCLRGGFALEALRARHEVASLFCGDGGVDFVRARETRLIHVLGYAARHTRYYADLFAQLGVDPRNPDHLRTLPLLDKAIIRAQRRSLVSDELPDMPHHVMNTGGSTGEPLEFLVSSNSLDPLHQEFLFRRMGYVPGDLVAAFDGTTVPDDLRERGVYWIHKADHDLPYGRIAFSSLYLSDDTIPRYVEHLLVLKPAFLRGYPSFIADIAAWILEHDITIEFQVKAVELTSENAIEGQVATIREAFGCRVFFQYGHSEACVFAFADDEHSDYLCSPVYGLTEIVNPDGTQVDVGQVGEIVVTGFSNVAMPFIRYRTGDLAVYGGDVRGIVRIRRLAGRTQDFIFAPDGRRVALTALIFGCHYHAFANIKKWQIVQHARGEVTIKILKDTDYCTADEHEIRDNFKRIAGVDSVFQYVDAIPRSPRGKSQLLVQHLGA